MEALDNRFEELLLPESIDLSNIVIRNSIPL
jgi:hypothetical protein